ncbi:hypothetical protein E1I18_02420 [Mycoplasmopsis mucosicanis]|uniref:Uncharacterized protein n=1 Tax=Mycoplasmopsis mucosicanis TaxID=458208 RepID=A0A507SMQ9_9BACT|nr:hypothetical protein [Mycoplasmopsis mucosicanis]TQC51515.1 hypothetical protein E1I18_02420 [Mycoplasmopsis mucosicanis]
MAKYHELTIEYSPTKFIHYNAAKIFVYIDEEETFSELKPDLISAFKLRFAKLEFDNDVEPTYLFLSNAQIYFLNEQAKIIINEKPTLYKVDKNVQRDKEKDELKEIYSELRAIQSSEFISISSLQATEYEMRKRELYIKEKIYTHKLVQRSSNA